MGARKIIAVVVLSCAMALVSGCAPSRPTAVPSTAPSAAAVPDWCVRVFGQEGLPQVILTSAWGTYITSSVQPSLVFDRDLSTVIGSVDEAETRVRLMTAVETATVNVNTLLKAIAADGATDAIPEIVDTVTDELSVLSSMRKQLAITDEPLDAVTVYETDLVVDEDMAADEVKLSEQDLCGFSVS